MLFTILAFILVLAVLVLVHEIGHFVTARIFGCKVEEFGFGFPPRILGWQKIKRAKLQPIVEQEKMEVKIEDTPLADGSELIKEVIVDQKREVDQLVEVKETRTVWGSREVAESSVGEEIGTIYSLNWIPLGGFVKIKGEDGDNRQDPDSFGSKKAWQRAIILFSGVAMNVVLAAFLLSIGFGFGLPMAVDDDVSTLKHAQVADTQIQIYSVIDNYPAQAAGIQPGDVVLNIDGQKFDTLQSLQDYISSKQDQEMSLALDRGGQEVQLKATPKYNDEVKRATIGIGLLKTGIVSYPWYLAAVKGVEVTGRMIVMIFVAFYNILHNLVVGQPVGVEVTGPVGIAVMTGQMARLGIIYILQFIALLSLNLAIINFLPFPALDGGRLLFLLIEKIRRKPINQQIENFVHNLGFILLMILMVFVTYRDVIKWGGGLWSKFFG
jgi:regulator of sigma E protease